jgi:type IV fimbrial biogenesis protein FimT
MDAAPQEQGLALFELLVVVTIVALLASLATPGFASLQRSSRVTTSVNQMVGTLHFARSSAILRGIPCVVCLSADGSSCLDQPGLAARSWLVFHDTERTSPVQRNAGEPLLRTFELPDRLTVRGTRSAVTYWPTSRAGTTSTFSFCYDEEASAARAVVVSQTGRPRVAAGTAKCA